jgi:UDP-GlcNAc:undecaprenyl-phosphate GlcNAc-1-phosphate transferase
MAGGVMAPEMRALVAVAAAGLLTTLLVPLAMRVAAATGFLDRPHDYKQHASPTPYLGGAALMAGVLPVALLLGGGAGSYAAIAGGAAVLFVIGTIDDRVTVRPRWRVLAEVGVAVALWREDLGWAVPGGDAVELVVTVIWVVALVNAFNLFDNMDGTCASAAAASALGLALLAAIQGLVVIAALALAVAGGCAGFLRFNLARPARIFLGDGGSMPLGFLIAALTMAIGPQDGTGLTAVIVAAPLVGIVGLDTALVIVSRVRAGVPILKGGRDHLTHRLARVLGAPRRVAATLALAQAAISGIAIASMQAGYAAAVTAGLIYAFAAVWAIARLEREPWLPARPAATAPAGGRALALSLSPDSGIEIAGFLRGPRFVRSRQEDAGALADVGGDRQRR